MNCFVQKSNRAFLHPQKFEGFFQDFLHNEERVQNNYNLIVFCWLKNFNSAFANYKFFDLQEIFFNVQI